MFGPSSYKDIPPEMCTCNCPRVYPTPQASQEPPAGPAPGSLAVEVGGRLHSDRAKPCYILIKLMPLHCRALRNYIVANSTKLSVINGNYCGIATKVVNLRSNNFEPFLAIGLLRFNNTEQACRFIADESRMTRTEFLGGRFDVWNLTLAAPDRSIVPNSAQPRKFVSSMCVFHMIHVLALALLPEVSEMSPQAKTAAIEESVRAQAHVEAQLELVGRYEGRLVVKTSTATRLRGQPFNNSNGEPRLAVYMTQWAGEWQFQQWLNSQEGRSFSEGLVELTGGSYESQLFMVSLDFVDLF